MHAGAWMFGGWCDSWYDMISFDLVDTPNPGFLLSTAGCCLPNSHPSYGSLVEHSRMRFPFGNHYHTRNLMEV